MEFSVRQFYYLVKPLIPRSFQIQLRRKLIEKKLPSVKNIWPIKEDAYKPPFNWKGWPDKKKFAFILTHDVELHGGHDKSIQLLKIEKELGFISSFNFVPERYIVSPQIRDAIVKNGFEVGVHGLNHEGKLYSSRREFIRQAKKINEYIAEWNAKGFRSPAMHHNLEWIQDLNIEYDLSTFDTDPFEPQSDGMNTIFPFMVKDEIKGRKYVEMPYTLPQDFTLLILMRKDISIWRKKIDWIADKGGMALINIHPDYINFENKTTLEEFPLKYYVELLEYVKRNHANHYWNVLPKDIASFWRENYPNE
jgi:peptidoglycan/xylan/chitin deacetylase (PgdA/CDA1 family)